MEVRRLDLKSTSRFLTSNESKHQAANAFNTTLAFPKFVLKAPVANASNCTPCCCSFIHIDNNFTSGSFSEFELGKHVQYCHRSVY
jgi:hypothetical protein